MSKHHYEDIDPYHTNPVYTGNVYVSVALNDGYNLIKPIDPRVQADNSDLGYHAMERARPDHVHVFTYGIPGCNNPTYYRFIGPAAN